MRGVFLGIGANCRNYSSGSHVSLHGVRLYYQARHKLNRIFIAFTVLVSSSLALAQSEIPPATPERKRAIVDTLAQMIAKEYLFGDLAEAAVELITDRYARGAYDTLKWLPDFTHAVTADLRSVTKDRHLGVWAEPEHALMIYRATGAQRDSLNRERGRYNNFGFEKVERLRCNIGYLKLNQFSGLEEAARVAEGAMSFLANSEAVIIDLRENGGGSPQMIQLMSSYFLNGRVHLNSFICPRNGKHEQYWTYANLNGVRMLSQPVYILQSSQSFSAAEEFAYNLQALRRATIIGDTTGGGAHDNHTYGLPDLGVTISIPFTRAVNPITGSNWEGVGVLPDIPCEDSVALELAMLEAARRLHQSETDERRLQQLSWLIDELNAHVNPVQLSETELSFFAGGYGPRSVTLRDGVLFYQRDNGQLRKLTPLTARRFAVEGLSYFRIEFAGSESTPAEAIIGLYEDGSTDRSDRTN